MKKTTIFIVGQSSVHWGRVEFGNIGNYYILEPAIRGLHKTFPNLELLTTLQLSEEFQQNENIKSLPLELYYGFKEDDLKTAKEEYQVAMEFSKTGILRNTTPYIEIVKESDLILDFSGDIWGDNADFLGENRFLVGLLKLRTAQLFGKKTAMIAGSPGPFSSGKNLEFAKEVFKNFDLITNRESLSRVVLEKNGFDLSRLKDLSCPSFLFEKEEDLQIENIHALLKPNRDYDVVGMILCGWNFPTFSFDKSQRRDSDYEFIVKPLIQFLEKNKNTKLCLLSHSNGFNPNEKPFRLLHGRDYENIKQLEGILIKAGFSDRVFALDGIYDPQTTKAIIGSFNMLISGRIHGAVAGFSQYVPTVVIDYGNGPKAHKLEGFCKEVDMLEYLADPRQPEDIADKIEKCYENLNSLEKHLKKKMPQVRKRAEQNFTLLKELLQ